MANLFARYEDPNYWDEGIDEYTGEVCDRRDNVGVIISYKDLKVLGEKLPPQMIEKLIAGLEHWGDGVRNLL